MLELIPQFLQYGALGVVVLALLHGIFSFVKYMLNAHAAQVKDLVDQQREVMGEVIKDVTTVVQKNSETMTNHTRSVENLTKAIHQQNSRHRKTDGRLND